MRQFPIMNGPPRRIPWDLIAPHERQALRNHGDQSLEQLAERGGLDPLEAICVLEDRRYSYWGLSNDEFARLKADARRKLLEMIREFENNHHSNVHAQTERVDNA